MWGNWQVVKPIGPALLNWWHEGKAKIKELAVTISKQQAYTAKQVERVIEADYQQKVEKFDKDLSLRNAENLEKAKAAFDKLERHSIGGMTVRARVRWYEQGERSLKYFLNPEKYRGNLKTFAKITVGRRMELSLKTQRKSWTLKRAFMRSCVRVPTLIQPFRTVS